MSKMDGLRAMREARYAENAALAKTSSPTAKKATAKPATAKADKTQADATQATTMPDADETVEPALCGHRNMSGRSCTREQGHAAKSHRYS